MRDLYVVLSKLRTANTRRNTAMPELRSAPDAAGYEPTARISAESISESAASCAKYKHAATAKEEKGEGLPSCNNHRVCSVFCPFGNEWI